MKVQIQTADSIVSVDGVATFKSDVSSIPLVHALSWDDSVNKGTIEYKVVNTPNVECTSVEEVDAGLGVTLKSFLDARTALIAARKKAHEDWLATQ